MNKIREATNTDAVIATNFGFCRETNCSQNDYRRLFLPALAHREPYLLVLTEVLTSEFPNQNSLSGVLDFVDSPTTPKLNTLVDAGVTHLLLDTTGASQSVTLQISSIGRVIFRISNFVFVDFSSGRVEPS